MFKLVAIIAFLCVDPPAQQMWKVCCSGAYGAQFTDLPPAVAAAAPGDTILVYYDVAGGVCQNLALLTFLWVPPERSRVA
jgi:hypothetical protein